MFIFSAAGGRSVGRREGREGARDIRGAGVHVQPRIVDGGRGRAKVEARRRLQGRSLPMRSRVIRD